MFDDDLGQRNDADEKRGCVFECGEERRRQPLGINRQPDEDVRVEQHSQPEHFIGFGGRERAELSVGRGRHHAAKTAELSDGGYGNESDCRLLVARENDLFASFGSFDKLRKPGLRFMHVDLHSFSLAKH